MDETLNKLPEHSVQHMTTGADIERIMKKIEPVVADEMVADVLMTMLAMAILLQEPYISLEDLTKGVDGASKWICEFLNTTDAAANLEQAEHMQVPSNMTMN